MEDRYLEEFREQITEDLHNVRKTRLINIIDRELGSRWIKVDVVEEEGDRDE